MDYANRKKSPMARASRSVIANITGLNHFSGISTLLSIHSVIFIAGKIMNISITMLKTSVKTIFSIGYIP